MRHLTINRPHTQAKKPTNLVIDYIPDGIGSGAMSIAVRNRPTVYKIRETKTDFDGRAFLCEKVFGGTDKESEAYSVFIASENSKDHDICGCKGFERFGHCKHTDAIRELLIRGVIDQDEDYTDQPEPEPPAPCEYCGGRGLVHDEDYHEKVQAKNCPDCDGTGILKAIDLNEPFYDEFAPASAAERSQPTFTCPLCNGTASYETDSAGENRFICFDCMPVGSAVASGIHGETIAYSRPYRVAQ